MRIIEPSYEILSYPTELKKIEQAGRVCYKSKSTEDSSERFVKMLIERGHESVLEHESITVKIVCDRAIANELVRHRIASYSQQSTRFCNFSKDKFSNEISVIKPSVDNGFWYNTVRDCERNYFYLLEDGYTPEIARSVLPLCLATEIVITANLREWRTIFKQRTAKEAHPQMREIMIPLLNELKNKIQIVFTDL